MSQPPGLLGTLLTYAVVGSTTLQLNVMDGAGAGPHPCVVHIHGGGWVGGSHTNMPTTFQPMIDSGVTVISVQYRLAPFVQFPTPIHDIKAAIRYIRANAATLNIDPARIALDGESVGGYFATIIGNSVGNPLLEGLVGTNPGVPTDVVCVVDYFGPSELRFMASDFDGEVRPATDWNDPRSGLTSYLGFSIQKLDRRVTLAAVELASTPGYISPTSVPHLVIHGKFDATVSYKQSERLVTALQAQGVPHEFHTIDTDIHGWWIGPQADKYRRAFLDAHL